MQNTTLALLGIIFGSLVLLMGGFVAFSYISAHNYGNAMEQQLEAINNDNQNILTSYYQKVREAASVTEMQRDDLKDVITAALAGRYGAEGSKAVFQSLREQNPQINSSVYIQIQRIVEAGRNEFKTAQTKLIDVRRAYKTAMGSFWQGLWLRMGGYPKKNPDDYKVILVEDVTNVYQSGKEAGPLKLR